MKIKRGHIYNKYAGLNDSIQGEFDNIATKLKVKSIKWVSLFC